MRLLLLALTSMLATTAHADNLEARAKKMFALYAKEGWPRANINSVADHIEHVIKIGGIDAVGLGTDFDGIHDPPTGFEDYSKLPKLVEELLRRGHSDANVKKILGGNFLAFFERVEATKKSLAKEAPSAAVFKKAK